MTAASRAGPASGTGCAGGGDPQRDEGKFTGGRCQALGWNMEETAAGEGEGPMSTVASLIALKEEMLSRTMQVAPLCPLEQLMWAPAPYALTLGQLLRHMHRSEYNRMRFLNDLIDHKTYYVLRHGEGDSKDLKATLGAVTDLDAELVALKQAHPSTIPTLH